MLTTEVDLSPLSWSGEVFIELQKDGVANGGNTTVHFRLVPMATVNDSGVILHDILTLTITDTDSKLIIFITIFEVFIIEPSSLVWMTIIISHKQSYLPTSRPGDMSLT